MGGEKILVVDDNIENCNMMADLLEQWGYKVVEAHQGSKVLSLIKQFQPDLLLLDVMLPGMNGFEICKRIKQSPETKNIAVIMLTVLDDIEDRTRGLSVGADLFISRPVNYKELQRQIKFVLSSKRKVMDVENPRSILEFILNLLRRLSPELYQQTLPVIYYGRNISELLGMDQGTITMIELSAAIHGLSHLFGPEKERLDIAREVLQPLEVAESLMPFLDLSEPYACRTCRSRSYKCKSTVEGSFVGAQVVFTAIRYCDILQGMGDKVAAYKSLVKKLSSGLQDCPVYTALAQVLDDEAFVEKFRSEESDIREL